MEIPLNPVKVIDRLQCARPRLWAALVDPAPYNPATLKAAQRILHLTVAASRHQLSH